ncbi:MAG TPA: CHAT domain-containing protein [Jiangellaceae bacterium]|nr:CHAT domain-containing protein [Jiangellaceae bacterium]
MTDYADLEIGLHRRDGVTWRVEVRYSQQESDADINVEGALTVDIDPGALKELELDPEAYGRALGQALLGGDVGDAYRQAIAAAQTQGVTLRVRLFVGPSATALHGLCWETMLDPRDGSPLLTDENIVFSRYLSSNDWRPVRLRPKSALRAVVVVSGPTDLDRFQNRVLAPVAVEDEVQRAQGGLSPLPTRVLSEHGEVTEERLFSELRDGCDVLYLVCHGYLAGDEPFLLLENEDGTAARIRGGALVDRIRDLTKVPRLVVLASCQSAGLGEAKQTDDGGVLAALGPRLAEAGIPAVLAMQGDISMDTVARFMPTFFHELQRDGQIDRAMAAARGAVRDRHDWWAPTLFMRLRSGRIWYESGFGRTGEPFDQFPALVHEITNHRCTPILGPGLSDQLLGSRQEQAQRWAKNFHFPMAPHSRDDLPQVAQYLAVSQSYEFPRDELGQYVRAALVEGYRDQLPQDYYRDRKVKDLPLNKLLSDVWRIRYPEGSLDPYAVLAKLPLPLYVTTQPANLLAEALRAEGKDPQVEPCRWKRLDDDYPWDERAGTDTPEWAFVVEHDPDMHRVASQAGWPTSVFERDRSYRPDERRPLVYHLFGHLARRRSLVITEDDYFDFLIGITRDKDLVPSGVRRAFADSSLMFLGFRLDEWDFRVLFRSIVNQEGDRRKEHTHVAVQIDPEEGSTIEPDRARTYLEKYFQGSNITIYWGSTESFIKQLHDAWAAEQ